MAPQHELGPLSPPVRTAFAVQKSWGADVRFGSDSAVPFGRAARQLRPNEQTFDFTRASALRARQSEMNFGKFAIAENLAAVKNIRLLRARLGALAFS